jgi:hypothetical protein
MAAVPIIVRMTRRERFMGPPGFEAVGKFSHAIGCEASKSRSHHGIVQRSMSASAGKMRREGMRE